MVVQSDAAGRRSRAAMSIASCLLVALVALIVPMAAPPAVGAAPGHSVELRVLVLAVGSRAADPARDVIETTLTNIGADYEVLDTVGTELTAAVLRNGGVGRFNGIVVTDGRLGGRFSSTEWDILHAYQRDFDVRQAVMSGPPSAQGDVAPGLVAAGLASGGDRTDWAVAAATLFPHLETANGPVLDLAAPTSVVAGGIDPVVTPLLRSSAGEILVARLDYADGREVLLSSLNHGPAAAESAVLAYAFVDFATRGLHLGAPRMFLSAHVDDVFIDNEMWAIGTGANGPERFRLSAADWEAAIDSQRALRAGFETAADFRLELAFNGVGASRTPGTDPLTDAAVASGDTFRWLSHTFTHRVLDASNGWSRRVIEREVLDNNALWSAIGLPGATATVQRALVTARHSGLSDGSLPYPDGRNPVMVSALTATGVRYVAGDTSRPNQDRPSVVPGSGGDLVLLPRTPTNLFYNTDTPARMTDEFNAIYGLAETYTTLRDRTAAQASAAVSSFVNFPFFFHQANLHAYDDAGNSLLFDWLNDVIERHETHFRLPLVNVPFHRIGELSEARLQRRTAGLRAQLALASGRVTLQADHHPVTVELTGVAGPRYGPVYVRDVTVDRPVTFVAAGYPSPAVPRCAGRPATMIGTPGADTLLGTAGDDVIVGLGGADTIRVGSGEDIVCGGAGPDVIVGGAAADHLLGGPGPDRLIGGPGGDRLVGGPGSDTCRGGPGPTTSRTCER